MAEAPLDSCTNCGHRDYQHHGSCVGAGLYLRWSRFLQVRCQCEVFVSVQAAVQQAQRELHAKAVCDCHVWPIIKEFHEYTVAVEAERDRAVGALVAEVGRGHEWDEKYDAAIERAEAAERDAAEQRALAEYAHTLAEATKAALECVNPDDEEGLRAFALTVADTVIEAPAEAQEEGD